MRWLFYAIVFALLASGCGDISGLGSQNGQSVGGTAASVNVTEARPLSLTLTPLNSTVPAGQGRQMGANATFTDGRVQNVTASATWGSSAVDIATVNATTGLVTAITAGNTTITATFANVSATTSLWVSPSSRFRAWTVGDKGRVLASSDGVTWIDQLTSTSANLMAVSFCDRANGLAVGTGGAIFGTNDGGDTWRAQSSGSTADLYGVALVSPLSGWVCGAGGVILRTSDAGATWLPQNSGTTRPLSRIKFVDATHGWTSELLASNTRAPVSVMRTTDGGASWLPSEVKQADNGTSINTISFISASEGWALGIMLIDNPVTFAPMPVTYLSHTADGGQTWNYVSRPPGNVDIQFVDSKTGYLVSGNLFARTLDGGKTFTNTSLPQAFNFNSLSFLDTNEGLVVGDRGFIYRSLDGVNLKMVNSGGENLHSVQILPSSP